MLSKSADGHDYREMLNHPENPWSTWFVLHFLCVFFVFMFSTLWRLLYKYPELYLKHHLVWTLLWPGIHNIFTWRLQITHERAILLNKSNFSKHNLRNSVWSGRCNRSYTYTVQHICKYPCAWFWFSMYLMGQCLMIDLYGSLKSCGFLSDKLFKLSDMKPRKVQEEKGEGYSEFYCRLFLLL